MTDAAIGLVFDESKTQVLVVKRRDVPVWVFPGGGVDEGETREEAVIREVFEETGFHAAVVRRTGEYYPLNKLAFYTVVFECQVIGGEATLSDETADVGFYPIHQLPHPFFHIHQDWLNDALSNPKCTVKKSIHQVTYWNLAKYFFRHPMRVLRTCLTRAKGHK